MRLYSPEGSEVVCSKEQEEILLGAGYTKELPKPEKEEPEAKEEPEQEEKKSKKITIKKGS